MTVVASVASFDDAYTASAAWEYAKQTVAAMLIDATKQRKLHRFVTAKRTYALS